MLRLFYSWAITVRICKHSLSSSVWLDHSRTAGRRADSVSQTIPNVMHVVMLVELHMKVSSPQGFPQIVISVMSSAVWVSIHHNSVKFKKKPKNHQVVQPLVRGHPSPAPNIWTKLMLVTLFHRQWVSQLPPQQKSRAMREFWTLLDSNSLPNRVTTTAPPPK